VSLVGLASAIAGAVPRILRYEDTAKDAATLQTQYGHLLGELTDAAEELKKPNPSASVQAVARRTVDAFEALKGKKDLLHIPDRDKDAEL